MTDVKDLGPLDWRTAIVDNVGRPSPEFQRRWNTQRQNNSLIGSITLGSGAPPVSPAPSDGQEYIDDSTSPFTLYVGQGGTWHQVSDVLNLIGSTQGDILYRNGTKWVTLPPGTSGEVLTTFGASANPQWQGIAGFTFACSGPVPANTLIGVAGWGKVITFNNGDSNNTGVALVPPASAYVFKMVDADTLSEVGQVQVSTSGTFTAVWDTPPVVWPVRKRMLVYSQVVPDTSFFGIDVRVVGYF